MNLIFINNYITGIRKVIALSLLSVLLVPTASYPQSPSNEGTGAPRRACRQSDLVGHTYKMVYFTETPPRAEASMFPEFPYQYLSFKNSGIYATLATNNEIATPKQLDRILQPFENGLLQYTLSSDGIMELLQGDKVAYNYRCIVMTRNEDEYIKGDLLLTAYTRRAKSVLLKLYRQWY